MNSSRARWAWLLTAALLALGSVAAGVLLVLAPGGTLEQRLTDGKATVALDPRTPLIVWSREPRDIDCDVRLDDENPSVELVNARFYREYELRTGGETLYAVLDVRGTPAGTYELTCGGGAVGVGRAPWTYRVRGGLAPGPSDVEFAVLAALPAVAAAAIVVRMLRRRRPGRPALPEADRSPAEPPLPPV